MNKILVDSSIWIDYFRNENSFNELSSLIRENQICTNDIILAELVPVLKIKKQTEIINGLLQLENIHVNINWNMIINYQIINLKNGINKVGIPDLIILDNVISNNLIFFSKDKHFKKMNENILFNLFHL